VGAQDIHNAGHHGNRYDHDDGSTVAILRFRPRRFGHCAESPRRIVTILDFQSKKTDGLERAPPSEYALQCHNDNFHIQRDATFADILQIPGHGLPPIE
jgi:hypothetical protein